MTIALQRDQLFFDFSCISSRKKNVHDRDGCSTQQLRFWDMSIKSYERTKPSCRPYTDSGTISGASLQQPIRPKRPWHLPMSCGALRGSSADRLTSFLLFISCTLAALTASPSLRLIPSFTSHLSFSVKRKSSKLFGSERGHERANGEGDRSEEVEMNAAK